MVTTAKVKRLIRPTADELTRNRVIDALLAAGADPADIAWLNNIYRKAAALTAMARGG